MKQLLTDAMAAAAALAAYRAEPLGWTAFSVHLSWDSTRGKKEARFPPGGWKANGGFAEDGWNGACIDTGRSKLTVVDFDGARGLAMAERIREALPPFETREAVTGSGGRHWYFTADPDAPVGNSTNVPFFGEEGTGVDVRGVGGCAFAPPSSYETPQGRRAYAWVDERVPLAAVPLGLWDLVRSRNFRKKGDAATGEAQVERPPVAPDQQPQAIDGEKAADVWLVHDLLRLLNPARRDDRSSWISVACALRHAGGAAPDLYKSMFLRWSAASPKYGGDDVEAAQWESLSRESEFGSRLLTTGSLVHWAKEDAAAGADEALAAARGRVVKNLTASQRSDVVSYLAASFPGSLADMNPMTTWFCHQGTRCRFYDTATGVMGHVDAWNLVSLEVAGGTDSQLGYIGGPVNIADPLSFLLPRLIPGSALFRYERESPELAHFRADNGLSMRWHGRPGEETNALEVTAPGRANASVVSKSKIRVMSELVQRGLDQQMNENAALATFRGAIVAIRNNNGTILSVNNLSVVNHQANGGDDVGACAAFLEWLSTQDIRIVSCCGRIYMYEPNEGVYRDVTDKRGLRRLIAAADIPEYSRNSSRQDALLKQLSDFAPQDDQLLVRAAATSLRKIAFSNGVYCFDAGTIVPFSPDIVLFSKLPHAFPDKPEQLERSTDLAREITTRVVDPIWGDVADFVMRSTARCAAGDISDKRAFFCLGSGNAGKGVWVDLVKSALRELVGTINSGNLLWSRQAGDKAKARSWMVAVKDCRLLFTSEIQVGGGNAIDGNMLKELASGGDEQCGRQNNVDEVTYKLQSMPWIMANDIPSIKPLDIAVSNRVCFIPMLREFHSDPAKYEELRARLGDDRVRRGDDSLKAWVARPEVGAAFAWMLCRAYSTERPPLPPQVTAETKEWTEEDSDDSRLRGFLALADAPEEFVTCAAVYERAKEAGMEVSKTKLGMLVTRSFGVSSVAKKLQGVTKNIYFGIKII
jgi:phage/plasmid-associated DNA primase